MTDPILTAFDRILRAGPRTPAVVGPDALATRGDLDEAASLVAELLAEIEVGDLVALVAPNGPGFLAAFLALRRRGAAALLADAGAPVAEVERIAAGFGARGILRCAAAWPRGPESWSFRALGSGGGKLAPGDVVKLTSGSSGDAKGIVASGAALVADEAQIASSMGIAEEDRITASVPLSHSYGLSSVAVPALTRGCAVVVPDESAGPWAGVAAARDLGATVFPTVPAFLKAWARLESPPPVPPSLRLVITAGAPIAPETARACRERLSLDVRVFYGSSETGGITFDRAGGAGERGTVGTPLDGVAVSLDPEDGTVIVASAAVASRYLGSDDRRLRGGRFRTSDAARLEPGGEVRLLGRDDWINVKGRKVFPREVERVLAEVEGVVEAVVLPVAGDDGEARALRAIVACGARPVARETLLAACRERLASHKVPRAIEIVDEIPRTDRGKIDRAALSALPE